MIFNGDHACNCWKKENPASEICCLSWRENFLEGPLPSAISDDRFDRIRADFLHTCVPEYSADGIYRYLTELRTTLKKFDHPDCKIVLYFDCCMYDMVMLARIFSLLKGTRAEIYLFCEDVILGCSPEVFRKEIASLRKIAPHTVELYARAWECILQGPQAISDFNAARAAQGEPFLAEAMSRYAEDHPCGGTLGRTPRQLLEIINSGISSFPEIFQAFDKYEKYMFMGDTHCLRLLDQLTVEGLIRKSSPDTFIPALSPEQ